MIAGEPILTKEEEDIVRKTWAVCAKDLKGNGAKIFIQFFKGYPQYQRLFRSFADVPIEQLATNKRLQAHGLTVASVTNALIENLDDSEILMEMLLKTGQNHGKRHVKCEDFENLKKSLLVDFFPITIGENWTKEANEAWDKLLTILTTKINEGLITGE